jgi:hypothetical protein
MSDHGPMNLRAARLCFAQTIVVLIVGLLPIPEAFSRARAALNSARSPELNRSDREATATSYYEGLIGGGDGPEGARGELTYRLLGRPSDWVRFHAANVSRHLDDDFLQFELKRNLKKTLFGHPFTTNAQGLRDRPYTIEKPANTFRIAVLGTSIDMGWGVGTEETYVNLFQDWLNAHAAVRGSTRRFEVINFAVAAYSPMQRLETFRRKAAAYHPDLVIYSATMLDIRLMEIHLCDLLEEGVDLHYDFLNDALDEAGVTTDDVRIGLDERLLHKGVLKKKLRPYYWSIYDQTLGQRAADCRAAGVSLVSVIVPRVGKADAPAARRETVARFRGIAAHHAIPVFDLSDAFDRFDPAKLEIAAWDDHPNTLGHQRLCLTLARAVTKDPGVYETLFP